MKSEEFNSKEEYHFAQWLEELKKEGLVVSYEYEPPSFILSDEAFVNYNKELKTKQKSVKYKLLRSLSYTTDFKVVWSDKADGLLTYKKNGVYKNSPSNLIHVDDDNTSYIEIKPSFDANNMTRHVKVKIAWVYQKYGTLVQIIKPYKLFKRTFFPDVYKYTDSGKQWRTIKINNVKEEVRDHYNFIKHFLFEHQNKLN